jgi:glutaredoxin-related protein
MNEVDFGETYCSFLPSFPTDSKKCLLLLRGTSDSPLCGHFQTVTVTVTESVTITATPKYFTFLYKKRFSLRFINIPYKSNQPTNPFTFFFLSFFVGFDFEYVIRKLCGTEFKGRWKSFVFNFS